MKFKAVIDIIGVNPFVYVPAAILNSLFEQAGKDKSPIPVCGTIDGYEYIQTLVKFRGEWRLYINGPMLKVSKKDVGESVTISITYDSRERVISVPVQLALALKNNKQANNVFKTLPPSRQKEIIRYISFLKTEESVTKNVEKAINYLLGKDRFVGRDSP